MPYHLPLFIKTKFAEKIQQMRNLHKFNFLYQWC